MPSPSAKRFRSREIRCPDFRLRLATSFSVALMRSLPAFPRDADETYGSRRQSDVPAVLGSHPAKNIALSFLVKGCPFLLGAADRLFKKPWAKLRQAPRLNQNKSQFTLQKKGETKSTSLKKAFPSKSPANKQAPPKKLTLSPHSNSPGLKAQLRR